MHPLQQLCRPHGLLQCAGDTPQRGYIQYLDVEQILTHVKPEKILSPSYRRSVIWHGIVEMSAQVLPKLNHSVSLDCILI